ncbi:MAG: alpha/beta hydrolase [Bacteroidaceae bacterium]|nr:alpha/beta hydrolase [Bacteroidaceae bacterium]
MKSTHNILYAVIGAIICLTGTLNAHSQHPQELISNTYMFVERDSSLCLDVYKPETPRADKAAVLMAFGGGFISGERNNDQMKRWASALLEHGFTVISIDYRLGFKDSAMVASHSRLLQLPDLFMHCIDIAVQDCAAAVAWVCSNAAMLDIDPSKLILTGSSAGAITILQLDYYRANSMSGASALPAGWKPVAVIPYSGGVMCRDSKLRYATDPAPTMLLHGTKDRIVTYKSLGLPFGKKMHGGKKMDKALTRQDIPHWFIRFEGIGHEVADWLPGSVDLFCTFVDLTLAGRITTLDATMSDSGLKPTAWAQMNMFQLYGGKR